MSTKNTTTGTNSTAFQFNPDSMKEYIQNITTAFPILRSFGSDPFGNKQFNFEASTSQDQANTLGQRNQSNVLNNAAAMGYGSNSGLTSELMGNAGRATSGLVSNAFRSAMDRAIQRQGQALGMLGSYQPLMTGSNSNFTQTQKTSGLGTWLPQVVGGAAGMAMNAFMPGASTGGGSVGGGTSGIGATGSGMSSINSGLGSIFGAPKGYGYGTSSQFPPGFNPFQFPGGV